MNAFQVSPVELENILLQHPGVSEAAVIGIDVPERATELPLAFVVPQPNLVEPLTERMIQDYISGKVVKYKRLEGGVKFVQNIPKAASGKILKSILREKVRTERLGRL